MKSGAPYASATGGQHARNETTKILRRFGCENVGFMDDFENHEVLLAFKHRGRAVQLRASAKGWAAMYMRHNPWRGRRRTSRVDYEQEVLRQGHRAVDSIMRDWVKGQITAIECGILQFDHVFMPYMITSSGRTVLEHLRDNNVLPAPETQA
jgi:hypothetical protein